MLSGIQAARHSDASSFSVFLDDGFQFEQNNHCLHIAISWVFMLDRGDSRMKTIQCLETFWDRVRVCVAGTMRSA